MMEDTGKTNILTVEKDDKAYPQMLKDIPKAPKRLFFRGNVAAVNDMPCLAVIGSRKASARGLEMAFSFGRMAAEAGFAVVNGLALGCDAEALRGALSAGGPCVAVLPCGLDAVYPKTNASLAEEVLGKNGCLVSEYMAGVRPQKRFFVERDRLQSGISQGVVVVESEEMGGTMHTVGFAERQHRRLACYYSKVSEIASGNRMMVEKGIGEALESEEDVRAFLRNMKEGKRENYWQMELAFT